MGSVLDRFLQYVQVNTQSVIPKEGIDRTRPSSEGQKVLAAMVKEDLHYAGVADDQISNFSDGSFLVHFDASVGFESKPHVVFAAHLDTYYGFSGNDVNPIIHYYEEGGDIVLPNGGVVIPTADLVGLEGERIVTADGSTLLGADDKAGVAAIVTVIEEIISEKISHGPLSFWFCVDEEIGALDISVIPEDVVKSWSVLWTVDGERLGPIDIGCFVCRMVPVTFKGVDAHPGVQGDKLKPAHYAAVDFVHELSLLPTPMNTRGQESFYYAVNIEGGPSKATVLCAPRTFDRDESNGMLLKLVELAQISATKYGCTVEHGDHLVCTNTRPGIEANMQMIQAGIKAHRDYDFDARLQDIRGGTDGAMANMPYPNLPAPNMGTGAKNLHGPQEFLVVRELELAVCIILRTIGYYKK